MADVINSPNQSSAIASHAKNLFAIAIIILAITAIAPFVEAQQTGRTVAITGDRLSGFVLPIEPINSDIRINALRAWAWDVDDTKRLLLEGDVSISIGAYSFESNAAIVWINRIPSADGLINQCAIYFDRVGDPTKQAGMGVGGERLLVTASARGDVNLNIALLEAKQPQRRPLLRDAEARLAQHLKQILADPPTLERRPQVEPPEAKPQFVPVPGGTAPLDEPDLPQRVELPQQPRTPWLAGPSGLVTFAANQVEIARGEEENVITATGSLVVEILADRNDDNGNSLTLSAERAVIFTDPGPLIGGDNQLNADNVRGVYLEGNVTVMSHDGEYFVRSPRAYYDFRTQQAVMVNSLLRVQPREFRVPVYARAEEMRQLSEDQWQAKRVTISASEFHDPHLAIGSEQATITRRDVDDGEGGQRTITHVDSRDNTVRLLDVPIFYWPRIQGDPQRLPIKSVQVGSRKNDGLRILTTWDLLALAGSEMPGVEAELQIDGFTERGAAVGTVWRYDVGASEGEVDLYGLYDNGEDRTSSGLDVEPEDEIRGVALWENQTQLNEFWTLQAQLSLISDETFITSWREDDFRERREYETSLYLKHQRDNAALTFLGKVALQDFVSNSYLLASRAYQVEKLPELTYRRYGDSLFGDAITYSTENRITRMAMVFTDNTPNELGVPGAAFGLGPDDNIADALFASGLNEGWYSRLDSRHEFSMPLKPGIFNVTPFVVGRFTMYDDEFEDFSSDADSSRMFGAAGVRINTQFQHVDNSIENQLFDLHRIRHLVEPYLTVWSAYTNVEQQDLPVFDTEVESLADGTAVQIGTRNTWQTQRGGPGRWRSVDWLMIDTSLVIDSSDEDEIESPTPQFIEFRPEYSQFGDHLRGYAMWLLSDHFTLAGDVTYSLDESEIARGSIGMEMRHSPAVSTYIEYRYIEANELELIDVGLRYQVTPKYFVAITPQFDLREDKFRAATMRIVRSFPDFDLIFLIRYDDIRDDTVFGASLGLTEF